MLLCQLRCSSSVWKHENIFDIIDNISTVCIFILEILILIHIVLDNVNIEKIFIECLLIK